MIILCGRKSSGMAEIESIHKSFKYHYGCFERNYSIVFYKHILGGAVLYSVRAVSNASYIHDFTTSRAYKRGPDIRYFHSV